jgi:NAD(P)-dependent dehydrogenase (short-subunit alcohol dehydrogenase family)
MSYSDEMFGLKDKIIIITGGGGVIAGAMSEALLKSGARIVLWDIAEEAITEAKKRLSDLTGFGDNIACVVVDAMSEESVQNAIKESEKSFGKPNILINAAGGNRGKSAFVDTDMKIFEFVLKLNLVAGLMIPTKEIAAYWIKNNIKGSVINLASMSSYIPLSGIWAYDAAKSGVLNLTMGCAKEFAPNGIRVNAIAPGFFVGKQNKALLIKDDKTGELTDRGKDIINHTPYGRFGEVGELAGATVFLCSDKAAGFISGICIPVDGAYLVDNI